MTPYKINFIIHGLPKTTNSGGRSHWSVKVKEANYWKTLVAAAVKQQRPKSPLLKAKVQCVRFSSVEPDFDGLVSSFKHVLDALKISGVIKDDKQSVIGQPIYNWERTSPKQGRIMVQVEEVIT